MTGIYTGMQNPSVHIFRWTPSQRSETSTSMPEVCRNQAQRPPQTLRHHRPQWTMMDHDPTWCMMELSTLDSSCPSATSCLSQTANVAYSHCGKSNAIRHHKPSFPSQQQRFGILSNNAPLPNKESESQQIQQAPRWGTSCPRMSKIWTIKENASAASIIASFSI